jgi:hypothetical protein
LASDHELYDRDDDEPRRDEQEHEPRDHHERREREQACPRAARERGREIERDERVRAAAVDDEHQRRERERPDEPLFRGAHGHALAVSIARRIAFPSGPPVAKRVRSP